MADEFQPDICLVGNIQGLNISLLREFELKQVPVIFDISDYWLLNYPEKDDWNLYWGENSENLIKRIYRSILRNICLKFLKIKPDVFEPAVDNAYFRGDFIKTSYLYKYPQLTNSPVVYHGVNISSYQLNNRGTDPDTLKVLFVGRIEPAKGAHILARAYIELDVNSSVSIALVGGSSDIIYVESLKSMLKDISMNKHVEFVGRINHDDVRKYYCEYDILVFPSIWEEPFPITLLEAMAAGIPVIASDAGGIPEIIKHNHNGLIYRRDSVRDLKEKLEYMIFNPNTRKSLSRNAHIDVKRFDINLVNERIVTYIKGLCIVLNNDRDTLSC